MRTQAAHTAKAGTDVRRAVRGPCAPDAKILARLPVPVATALTSCSLRGCAPLPEGGLGRTCVQPGKQAKSQRTEGS